MTDSMDSKSPDESLLDGLHVHPLDASAIIQIQKWLTKMLFQQLPCVVSHLRHQIGSAARLAPCTIYLRSICWEAIHLFLHRAQRKAPAVQLSKVAQKCIDPFTLATVGNPSYDCQLAWYDLHQALLSFAVATQQAKAADSNRNSHIPCSTCQAQASLSSLHFVAHLPRTLS